MSVSFYGDLLLMLIMFGGFAPCGSIKVSENVDAFVAPTFIVKVHTAVTRLLASCWRGVKRQSTEHAPPDIHSKNVNSDKL